MANTTERTRHQRPTSRPAEVAFSVLIGFAALAVLLQGLWAGIFLEHDGARDAASGWIDVHARGADIALVLALAAAAVAFLAMRARRALWVGSLVLALLIAAEAYLGGLIRDDSRDVLTAVHVPLAMVIMGLAAWLPFRSRAGRPKR